MFTDVIEHNQLAKFYLLQNTHCHLQFQNNKGRAQKDRAVQGEATLRLLSWPKRVPRKKSEHLWRSGPFKALAKPGHLSWKPHTLHLWTERGSDVCQGLHTARWGPKALQTRKPLVQWQTCLAVSWRIYPLLRKINPQGTCGKDTILWAERTAELRWLRALMGPHPI